MSMICATSILSGFSEQTPTQNQTKSQNGEGLLKEINKGSIKKRIPSRNFIEVYYENGLLTLQSESASGVYDIELVSSEADSNHTVLGMSIGESIVIDLECGSYYVTANGNDTSTFAGSLLIY